MVHEAQRLSLLKNLARVYHESIRPDLHEECDRKELVQAYFKETWVSKLVPKHHFFQVGKDAIPDKRALVLSSGPYVLRLLELHRVEASDTFTCQDSNLKVWEQFAGDATDITVAPARPCVVQEELAWEQVTDFIPLAEFVASESILTIPRSLLSGLCSSLFLKHSKLSYKERVRLFLEFMKKDKSYIDSILEEIPEKEIPEANEDTARVCMLPHILIYGFVNSYPNESQY